MSEQIQRIGVIGAGTMGNGIAQVFAVVGYPVNTDQRRGLRNDRRPDRGDRQKGAGLEDSYGFVVNRVLIPMINEAINCVYEGLATPEDVDAMMKLGANHPMGPLSLADLIGLDIVLDIMQTLYGGFDDPKYRPSPLLKQMCDAGYFGRKTTKGFFSYEARH